MTDRPTQHRVRVALVVSLLLFGSLLASLPAAGFVPLPTAGNAGNSPVEPGATISTAGTYELSGNATATNTSNGVTVTGSSVELDGRGYRLNGPATAGSIGVYVPADAGVSSLVLRNLTLSGWETGVLARNVSTVTIRATEVYSNRTGIRVERADTVRIVDSTLVVDDGTYFEDVDRLILENSTITTVGSESIVAENTTVYVGRGVRLTGGVLVRSGVVKVIVEPTVPEPADVGSDVDAGTATGTDPETSTTTESPTTASRVEPDSGSGNESSSDLGGSAPPAGGTTGGSVPVGPVILPERPTLPTPETPGATETPQTQPEGADAPSNSTEPDASSDVGGPSESASVDSPTDSHTGPGQHSSRTTGRPARTTESTPVQTPGFGVVLTLSALVMWFVLSTRRA